MLLNPGSDLISFIMIIVGLHKIHWLYFHLLQVIVSLIIFVWIFYIYVNISMNITSIWGFVSSTYLMWFNLFHLGRQALPGVGSCIARNLVRSFGVILVTFFLFVKYLKIIKIMKNEKLYFINIKIYFSYMIIKYESIIIWCIY